MAEFTVEDVSKIAKLCSLKLDEQEQQKFAKHFSTILDYFQVLEQAELPGNLEDPDESHQVIYRKDSSSASSIYAEDFSPYVENHCFKVPKVIESGS